MTMDNRVMTIKERYLLFKERNQNQHLEELTNLMEQVEENPSSVGIKSLERRLEELSSDIKQLGDDDRELIERLSNHVLFSAKKEAQDLSKWEFFVDTAKKNNWTPVLEMIEMFEENEKHFENIRSGTKDVDDSKLIDQQERDKEDLERMESMLKSTVIPWAENTVSRYYRDLIDRTLHNKLRIIQNRLKRNTDLAFADWLKHTRKAKKMTLQEVAEKSNTSISYIQRLEKGKRKVPSLPIVQSISEAVDVPFQDVLAIINGNDEADTTTATELFDKVLRERYSINGQIAEPEAKHLVAQLLRAALNANGHSPLDNIVELPNIARRLQNLMEKTEQEDMSDVSS